MLNETRFQTCLPFTCNLLHYAEELKKEMAREAEAKAKKEEEVRKKKEEAAKKAAEKEAAAKIPPGEMFKVGRRSARSFPSTHPSLTCMSRRRRRLLISSLFVSQHQNKIKSTKLLTSKRDVLKVLRGVE